MSGIFYAIFESVLFWHVKFAIFISSTLSALQISALCSPLSALRSHTSVVRVSDVDVDISITLSVWVGLHYVIIIRHVVNPNTTSRVSTNWITSYDGLCQEGVSANRCVMLSDDGDRFAHASVTIHTRAWEGMYILFRSNSKLRLQDEIAQGNMAFCASVSCDANSSTTGR
jgi:hypothetical protein